MYLGNQTRTGRRENLKKLIMRLMNEASPTTLKSQLLDQLCSLYEAENRALVASSKKPPGKVLTWPPCPLAVRRYDLQLDHEWRFVNLDAEVAKTRDFPLLGVRVWDAWPDLMGSRVQIEYQNTMESRIPKLFDNDYAPMGARHQHWVYPVEGGIAAHIEEFELTGESKLALG